MIWIQIWFSYEVESTPLSELEELSWSNYKNLCLNPNELHLKTMNLNRPVGRDNNLMKSFTQTMWINFIFVESLFLFEVFLTFVFAKLWSYCILRKVTIFLVTEVLTEIALVFPHNLEPYQVMLTIVTSSHINDWCARLSTKEAASVSFSIRHMYVICHWEDS